MLTKAVLEQAKAFLCWDHFPNLSIKLIELKDSVGFYFPPNQDTNTILLFYHRQTSDFSKPLFLLFHEAGHHLQYLNYNVRGFTDQFIERMNQTSGREKAEFETEAWKHGELLLRQFLKLQDIETPNLILKFNEYAYLCIQTYQNPLR